MLVVTAAVLKNEQGYWLVRRGPHMSQAGIWEFPGGKVEPGESPQQALKRELYEEFLLQVEVGPLLGLARNHQIELQAYQIEIQVGCPQCQEHDAQVIVPHEHLKGYPMTELDLQIVEQLSP